MPARDDHFDLKRNKIIFGVAQYISFAMEMSYGDISP